MAVRWTISLEWFSKTDGIFFRENTSGWIIWKQSFEKNLNCHFWCISHHFNIFLIEVQKTHFRSQEPTSGIENPLSVSKTNFQYTYHRFQCQKIFSPKEGINNWIWFIGKNKNCVFLPSMGYHCAFAKKSQKCLLNFYFSVKNRNKGECQKFSRRFFLSTEYLEIHPTYDLRKFYP